MRKFYSIHGKSAIRVRTRPPARELARSPFFASIVAVMSDSVPLLVRSGELLEALRARGPLVQCLTNTVAENFTANVLLAVGASPAMIHDPEEAAAFAAQADATLVNVGTLTREQAEAMGGAMVAAHAAHKPWVLDPVGVGGLPFRTKFARDAARRFPAMIRGNASEILGLSGAAGGRGVDSTATVGDAADAARALSDAVGATVLVTGPDDLVVGPNEPAILVANGTPMLTRVTGVGCSQGALCAAFCAVAAGDFAAAALAAALTMSIAGELALETASRPGSFQAALLDALDAISPADILARGKVFQG